MLFSTASLGWSVDARKTRTMDARPERHESHSYARAINLRARGLTQ
jgi:hypothetical protein